MNLTLRLAFNTTLENTTQAAEILEHVAKQIRNGKTSNPMLTNHHGQPIGHWQLTPPPPHHPHPGRLIFIEPDHEGPRRLAELEAEDRWHNARRSKQHQTSSQATA